VNPELILITSGLIGGNIVMVWNCLSKCL
jgi:hypothetical protein